MHAKKFLMQFVTSIIAEFLGQLYFALRILIYILFLYITVERPNNDVKCLVKTTNQVCNLNNVNVLDTVKSDLTHDT